jgi:hypothetical protein
MTMVIQKQSLLQIATVLLVTILVVATLVYRPRAVHSQVSSTAIAGYIWSDTIGWIDLNCLNAGTCGANPFGFSLDGNGILSGYAWSDNIGWISANASDLAGCPTSPCTATIQGGALNGWLKATAADNNGWDGWISLSGTSPVYGPTLSNGRFSGYAWGNDVVGWIDFSFAYSACGLSSTYSCSGQTIVRTDTAANCAVTTTTITPNCTLPSFCSPGSAICLYPQPSGVLTISPLLAPKGKSVHVSWNIGNVQSCTVRGDNGDGSGANSTGVWSGLTGDKTSSGILQVTTYTLSCVVDDPNAPPFTQSVSTNIVPSYREK